MNKEILFSWYEEGSLAIPKILLNTYVSLGLTEEEVMLLIHVYSFINSGQSFPTPTEISEKMTLTTTKCTEILRHLLQKGYLGIEEGNDENSIIFEKYTLKPLWEKIYQYIQSMHMAEQQERLKEEEINLYTMFEQEFGRPLSPFECESLTMWVDQDHHDPVIIKAALRESVLSGKLNFRYIDRILFEWKKNGIKTIEQAKNHGKKFRQHQQRQKQNELPADEYKRTVPFYNWLDT